MHFKHLTEDNLNKFRSLFPEDNRLQELSIDELKSYSQGKEPDGSSAETASVETLKKRYQNREVEIPLTPCQQKIAVVVVDAFFAITMAGALKGKISQIVYDDVGTLLFKVDGIYYLQTGLSDFDDIVQTLGNEASTIIEKIKSCFRILRALAKGGQLGMVWGYITKSLTWYDFILYGTVGLAEIFALLAAPEISAGAIIVQEAAQIDFLAIDSLAAIEECKKKTDDPTQPWVPGKPIEEHLVKLINWRSRRIHVANSIPRSYSLSRTITNDAQGHNDVITTHNGESIFKIIRNEPQPGSVFSFGESIWLKWGENIESEYYPNRVYLSTFSPPGKQNLNYLEKGDPRVKMFVVKRSDERIAPGVSISNREMFYLQVKDSNPSKYLVFNQTFNTEGFINGGSFGIGSNPQKWYVDIWPV